MSIFNISEKKKKLNFPFLGLQKGHDCMKKKKKKKKEICLDYMCLAYYSKMTSFHVSGK